MGDLKARLRARFSRKSSTTSSILSQSTASRRNSNSTTENLSRAPSSLENGEHCSSSDAESGGPVSQVDGSSGRGAVTHVFTNCTNSKKRISAIGLTGVAIAGSSAETGNVGGSLPSPPQNLGGIREDLEGVEDSPVTKKDCSDGINSCESANSESEVRTGTEDGIAMVSTITGKTPVGTMHGLGSESDGRQLQASDAGGNDQQTRHSSASTATDGKRLSSINENAVSRPNGDSTTNHDHSLLSHAEHESDGTSAHHRDLPTSPNVNVATPRPAKPVAVPDIPDNSTGAPASTNFRDSPALTPRAAAPPLAPRRPSQLANRQSTLIRALLQAAQADDFEAAADRHALLPPPPTGAAVAGAAAGTSTGMARKIWVKRPGASATLITIHDDDLVDDVRELILRKYGNSLGRQFDAPDLTLRIVPREPQRQERVLGPEEPMGRTLDAYFPGGQAVDEALVIDVPLRRSPKASPRTGPPHATHLAAPSYYDETRPSEGAADYFGPGAVAQLPVTVTGPASGAPITHAISVLSTGQVPQIPSPGGGRSRTYRERPERPRLGRQHTSSPTVLGVIAGGGQHPGAQATNMNTGAGTQVSTPRGRPRTHSNASSVEHNPINPELQTPAPVPAAPPIPTPPADGKTIVPAVPVAAGVPGVVPAAASTSAAPGTIQRVATPPPRVSSPRPSASRPKKKKNTENSSTAAASSLTLPGLGPGLLNGSVPPINVLIVEDNIINLRLLEAFVKKLKVRWQTAMNGRDAVTKWRTGGFHLVLMDIQLPVMSGLEATREIRRLERVNSIGAFSMAPPGRKKSPQKRGQSQQRHGQNKQGKGKGKGRKKGGDEEEDEDDDDDEQVDVDEEEKRDPELDKLNNTELFKSPVIIVALTASSLQSDRHEALAAGCNDFLTKPVNFMFFERKVREWGCMQALIDFDGWRKWKDYSQQVRENEAATAAKKAGTASKAKTKKYRLSASSAS